MTPEMINFKDMIRFIRNLGMDSIPQSVFYAKVHETHKKWDDKSIASCLRYLRENHYIDIGLHLEIIPMAIPEKEMDALEEFDDQTMGKWVGKNAMFCPE